jgi:hypothetical protein
MTRLEIGDTVSLLYPFTISGYDTYHECFHVYFKISTGERHMMDIPYYIPNLQLGFKHYLKVGNYLNKDHPQYGIVYDNQTQCEKHGKVHRLVYDKDFIENGRYYLTSDRTIGFTAMRGTPEQFGDLLSTFVTSTYPGNTITGTVVGLILLGSPDKKGDRLAKSITSVQVMDTNYVSVQVILQLKNNVEIHVPLKLIYEISSD